MIPHGRETESRLDVVEADHKRRRFDLLCEAILQVEHEEKGQPTQSYPGQSTHQQRLAQISQMSRLVASESSQFWAATHSVFVNCSHNLAQNERFQDAVTQLLILGSGIRQGPDQAASFAKLIHAIDVLENNKEVPLPYPQAVS